jgi:hypothetical protein
MTKTKACDCDLCQFKLNPTIINVLSDKNKILESLIYHFIFRIGSLIKSKKEINSRAIHFISAINQDYDFSSDSTKINDKINTIHKNITDSDRFSRYPPHISLSTIIDKELNYLKKIMNINLTINNQPVLSTITEKIIEKVEEKVEEKINEVIEKVQVKVEENIEEKVEEKINEIIEKVEEKVEEKIDEKIDEKVDEVIEKVEEKVKDNNYLSYCVIC